MEKYTIQTVLPTGKTNPNWGIEYHVKFAESEQTFKLYYKNPPKEGQIQEGTIDDWKFTKKPYESKGTVAAPRSPKSDWVPEKERMDGQRQGMCFNNASQYVTAMAPGQPITPDKWAKTVYGYAQALYELGDLGSPARTQVPTLVAAPTEEVTDNIQNVKNVFGV